MVLFGHLGIGSTLVGPWAGRLSRPALLLGTLLPDLIDKPIYWSLAAGTGKWGADLGLISSGQAIAHTGLFLLVLLIIAAVRRSRLLAAITLGLASHLFLDNLMDHFRGVQDGAIVALLFPLHGWRFSVIPAGQVTQYLSGFWRTDVLVTELLGLALLGWAYWKKRHSVGIGLRRRRLVD